MFNIKEETKPNVLAVCSFPPESQPRHLRGVGLCVTLQEETHALLVWPVGVEAGHHHYLPWKVTDKAGWAEHRLAEAAEALHHKPEGCL